MEQTLSHRALRADSLRHSLSRSHEQCCVLNAGHLLLGLAWPVASGRLLSRRIDPPPLPQGNVYSSVQETSHLSVQRTWCRRGYSQSNRSSGCTSLRLGFDFREAWGQNRLPFGLRNDAWASEQRNASASSIEQLRVDSCLFSYYYRTSAVYWSLVLVDCPMGRIGSQIQTFSL